MKPECEAAVRAVAGDRELSKADIAGIETRLHQAAKTLKRQNPAAWDVMQPTDRLKAAAKLARASHLEQMAKAHSIALQRAAIKLRRDAEIAAVPKGRQLDALNTSHFMMGGQGKSTSLEAEIDAEMARVKTMLTGKEERVLDDAAVSDKVARAIRGEETGDPEAQKLAKRVTDLLEQNRQRMEDVGIPISPLENWHYPQHQEWTKLAASKEQEWVDDHRGWINHREYINRDGSQMTPEQIDAMLRESWMTIHTNGANKRAEQTTFSGGGKIGATLNAPRQLHYKDAASWKAAMTKYGVSNNIGQILRAHMGRTARMIAIAAREGNLADRDVQQRAQQALYNDLSVAETAKQKTKLEAEHKKFLLKWNVQQHGIGQPGNARVATVMNFVRNLMSSSVLGSLVSQQPSDSLMALTLLKSWGFDVGGKGRFLAKFGEGLAGSRLKDDMRRLQTWTDNSHAQTTRFVDDEFSNRASRFLNGGVYVLSGMRRADFATTGAIVDSVLGTIGRDTRKFANVADMPEGDANYAQRFGINQEHWDVMRAAELDHGLGHGDGYVTPQGIYSIPDALLADKAAARAKANGTDIATETRRLKDDTVRKLMAVYQETLHTAGRGFSGSTLTEKARLGLLSHDAGTPLGEALRMLYLVRQVPFGMAMTHLWDVPRGMTGWKSKAAYVTRYLAGQMAATAFAIQAKHVIAGEDPEDMTRPAFIGKMIAGAGIGPMLATIAFGDLGEGDNEAGKFLGPGANAAGQLYGLAARGITELHGGPATGKDGFDAEKYSSQWLSFVRHNAVPFGNMWWTKAVVNHMLYQQAQEQLSPGYNERVQRRLEHENRNTWWNQGDMAPRRAPDFGAAAGQPAQ